MFGNFYEAQFLAESFRYQLSVLENDLNSARKQGKTECCRSGLCCWRRPGQLLPGDEIAMAQHLNITVEQLFEEYLVVDVIHGVTCLLPKRKGQEGGRMLGWRDTYKIDTPCVFLDTENNNACKVHEVKPAACKGYQCWVDNDAKVEDFAFSEERLRDMGWDGYNPDDGEGYDD